MKFSQLGKFSSQANLVVSPRHERWLAANANPVYSESALAFARSALVDMGRPRDRRGTISASSFGSCPRKQQFTFIGLPELPPTSKLAQIFQNGTLMHIRWQMAGLTEGWLAEAEVPVGDNRFGLSGTQDGIADDGTVVELKSINSNGYRNVASFGPKQMHILQVATYVMTTGAARGTIVYENKDTQEFTEKVIPAEELPIPEMKSVVEKMWDYITKKILFEPLDACEMKEGMVYRGCPFRDNCLAVKSWDQAEEIADAHRA